MTKKIGPEYGTAEYKDQVDTIYTAVSTSGIEAGDLGQALMLYICDESFSRAAICEAEKKLKREHFRKD